MLALRFFVPALVFAYLLYTVPMGETVASLKAIPVPAAAQGLGIGMLGMLAAALRWHCLFTACAIADRPSLLQLYRLHLIGSFYNIYLPGGVGGDVIRAIATRPLFGERGIAGALALVMLERALGFSGMLIVVALTFSYFPLGEIPNVMLWSAVGLCVGAVAVVAIATGARVARFLPGPLARFAAALPTVVKIKPFAAAVVLSVVTQASVILVGHVLISSLSQVTLKESMVVMPLVGAAQYFPLSVGGAGVREATLMLLYGMVGVAKPAALAGALAFAAVTYVIAGLGGILHVLRPLRVDMSAVQPRG
jgi:glycosyltransferase 2 family protein